MHGNVSAVPSESVFLVILQYVVAFHTPHTHTHPDIVNQMRGSLRVTNETDETAV